MKTATGKLWVSLRSRLRPDSWWTVLWISLFLGWAVWLATGGYWFYGAAMAMIAYTIWLTR